MMKSVMYIFIMGIFVLFTSCEFEEDQMGLPKKVVFTNEGGEKVLSCEQGITQILIAEGTHEVGRDYNDNPEDITVSYKWLVVKSIYGNKEFTIIAKPSIDDRSPDLKVYVYSGNIYATINVKQN